MAFRMHPKSLINLSAVLSVILFAGLFGSRVFAAGSVVGTWEVESNTITDEGGKESQACPPSGLLSYTADGYVFAAINCNIPAEKDGSVPARPGTFYGGTYYSEKDHFVHLVMNAYRPEMIGFKMIRTENIEQKNGQERLVITGTLSQSKKTFKITFKRAPDATKKPNEKQNEKQSEKHS